MNFTTEQIINAAEPVEINETEEIEAAGHRGVWANKADSLNWRRDPPIHCYPINQDPAPDFVTKRTNQKIQFEQEIAIRYLRPPTPPASGDILIVQEPSCSLPPAPPLIIRQRPTRPSTPPPLVIREAPPAPPPVLCSKLIRIPGTRLPPPPRKVIVERLPVIPVKPQSILIERWLPYARPRRRVIFQQLSDPNAEAAEQARNKKIKNLVVQWDTPRVVVRKKMCNLGVVKADPACYKSLFAESMTTADRLPEFVRELPLPNGLNKLAADESPFGQLPELYGDLDALNLIDMDREGLSAYKSYQTRRGSSVRSSSHQQQQQQQQRQRRDPNRFDVARMTPNETMFLKAYFTYRVSQITVMDMRQAFTELNRIFCKSYGERDVCEFFEQLDADCDRLVDFQDFKRVFAHLF
jgi:hypothetical protein